MPQFSLHTKSLKSQHLKGDHEFYSAFISRGPRAIAEPVCARRAAAASANVGSFIVFFSTLHLSYLHNCKVPRTAAVSLKLS